jgi:DNA polymerase III epsilon subunit-like protein
MVSRAPSFADLAETLYGLLADRIVVAHNLDFDGRFLMAEFAGAGLPLPEIASGVCTLRLAQRHLPGPPHKLADCCRNTGIELIDAHSAVGDATATASLLAYFLARGVVGPRTVARPVVPGQRSGTGTAPLLPRRGR